MKSTLSILHLEDSPDDSELAALRLARTGMKCEFICARTRDEFATGLAHPGLDVIMSDFSMPGFDGISALKMAREKCPDVPFIFVSGTIGEELAVEALKLGARDYVLKDRLSRLPSSVERAVRETAELAEKRRMEDRIREQAAWLDRAQDAICLTDVSHRVLYWNRSAERLYGWTAAEVAGRNIHELLSPEDPADSMEVLRSLTRDGEWLGDLYQANKQGRRLVVESRWTRMKNDRAAESILIINTDVTEKRELEAQAQRSQRIDTLGGLAGGIAHDLNNSLTPVMLGVTLLRNESLSPQGQQMLDLMAKSARHGANMVKQILGFSRGISGKHSVLDSRQLVMDMVRLAKKTFPRTVSIHAEIEDDIWPVIGNPTQLHQVLLNLCVNARDAMPSGGTLAISAGNLALGHGETPVGWRVKPGAFVTWKISDTGEGIPPENIDKIFKPFFSTKEPGRGTGLGLSTVMGIVKNHSGFLEVESPVGHGTTFKVCLPAGLSGQHPDVDEAESASV